MSSLIYLNSLNNIPNYQDEFSQALNFGIYGVDIIYEISHDHTAEIVKYREKTLEMASTLGLDSFYIEEDMNKFKEIAKDNMAVSQFIFDEYVVGIKISCIFVRQISKTRYYEDRT